jgi:hypothetical protein
MDMTILAYFCSTLCYHVMRCRLLLLLTCTVLVFLAQSEQVHKMIITESADCQLHSVPGRVLKNDSCFSYLIQLDRSEESERIGSWPAVLHCTLITVLHTN